MKVLATPRKIPLLHMHLRIDNSGATTSSSLTVSVFQSFTSLGIFSVTVVHYIFHQRLHAPESNLQVVSVKVNNGLHVTFLGTQLHNGLQQKMQRSVHGMKKKKDTATAMPHKAHIKADDERYQM